MDWQLSVLNPCIVPLSWSLVRTPPDKRDPKVVQDALDKTSAAWRMVENQLAHGVFIGGDNLSLGDIPIGVWAYRWYNLPIERPKLSRLEAWYERLRERPAY